jgi:hypothetical protein
VRGIVSVGGNGHYCSTKFSLEGLTEALWQEIEPLGLRAFLVEPGPRRTGMDTRVRFSGSRIDAYEGSSGRLLRTMATIKPEQFQGDPTKAAAAIDEEVRAGSGRHRLILGSEAYRQDRSKTQRLLSRNSSLPRAWPSAVATQTRVRVFYDEVVISVYKAARLSASARQDRGRKSGHSDRLGCPGCQGVF